MIVGAAIVRLRLPAARSLKEKRQVVKSVVDRVKGRFNVSAAEVGEQEAWQLAEIGIACAASHQGHAEDILRTVVGYIEESRLDVEVLDVVSDVLTIE
ncbi:MAG: DUF503 domain-containing protein [Chloroflexota bacterium]|nr:DUF503 domain-containing protein [Dehalococcoidia bacterium]MDW8253358.1 DUF503 domain-containing protein [Chloroflexota bacterium]